MKKSHSPKLFEYRIKYNIGASHAEMDNYHYYNAFSAEEALNFHLQMVEKHNLKMQTISVEKYNPYADRWEDESEIINHLEP